MWKPTGLRHFRHHTIHTKQTLFPAGSILIFQADLMTNGFSTASSKKSVPDFHKKRKEGCRISAALLVSHRQN
jgi:hypothetical protein